MINNYHKLAILIIAVFGFAACTQERLPCPEPTIMSVVIGCHQVIGYDTLHNPIIADTTLSNPIIEGRGVSGDTVGLIYRLGSKQLIAHMSPIVDSCQWYISLDSIRTSTDTLTFHYQHQLDFLSNACGYTYFYNLLSVSTTTHFIDSVKIVNAGVTTNINTEHVKVYIRRAP